MRSKKPLISIIIPVYNNTKYLPNAVNSVIDQPFENWELIIVDDGSNDGTGELADHLASSDDRISVIHQNNQWIYASMNNGIASARGEYIYILNSDDALEREALGILSNKINAYDFPDVIWTVVACYICDENQKIISRIRATDRIINERFAKNTDEVAKMFEFLVRSLLMGNQANLYRRDLMIRHPFRNDVYGADYLFNLDVFRDIESCVVLPDVIYRFYQYDNGRENTSVGKYYDYEHDMFSEFYDHTISLVNHLNVASDEMIFFTASKRVSEFNLELKHLEAKNCKLTISEKLENIYCRYVDNTVLEAARICGRQDDVERFAINESQKIIKSCRNDLNIKMSFVCDLIDCMKAPRLNRSIIDRVNQAVYNQNNPKNVGELFYKRMLERFDHYPKFKDPNSKRVLWLCNIVLPELCDVFLFKRGNMGGWLDGMWQQLKNDQNFIMGVCVPIRDKENCMDGEYESYKYYSFSDYQNEDEIDNMTERFCEILDDFNPDIIHIWGTEYLHTDAMVRACKKKNMADKVLIHVQGLVSAYASAFYAGLNKEMICDTDLMSSIDNGMYQFEQKGRYEAAACGNINHIGGRTDWDREWCSKLAPNAEYHVCGEILRDEIYRNKGTWNRSNCDCHRIFISQASYPIKGVHLILESIKELSEEYSDLRIIIGGASPIGIDDGYSRYLEKRIIDLGIADIISFSGQLNTKQMINEYQRASVFLSPSTIENSSNSICEAMCIGTPVVASYVGGNSSLIRHGISGYLYPLDESMLCVYYIKKIFEDPDKAERISIIAQDDISNIIDPEKNKESLRKVYQRIG